MVETLRPLFISFSSKITKEGEDGEPLGTPEVFTQIQDCPVTDEELLEIKRIQAEAAEKIDALFRKKGGERVNQLKEKAKQIAGKYFDLVEKRIDSAEELMGSDLRDIYEGIQMVGHITTTLEKFSCMEFSPAAEPHTEAGA